MRSLAGIVALALLALGACTSAGATASPTAASVSTPASTPATTPTPTPTPTAGLTTAPATTPSASAPTASQTPVSTTVPTGAPPSAQSSAAPTVATWTKLRPPAGPSPREDHTWTVDTDGQKAYLFGGRAGGTLHADLWVYDLAADTWSELGGGAGPAARFGHEAVWLPGRGLLIFAGQAGPTFFNDLWLFDPTAGWSQLPAGGDAPVPRYGTCAALGPDGRLWISHGFTEDGRRFADTRVYDFTSGSWTDETPANGQLPVARCLHGCWFNAIGEFVLYAGQTTGVTALGDLWARVPAADQPAVWRPIDADLPPARNLYAHAPWQTEQLVFGGLGDGGTYLNDLWGFNLMHLSPRPIEVNGDPPPGRSGATLIADPARNRLLLFGGKRDGGTFEDLWRLTIT